MWLKVYAGSVRLGRRLSHAYLLLRGTRRLVKHKLNVIIIRWSRQSEIWKLFGSAPPTMSLALHVSLLKGVQVDVIHCYVPTAPSIHSIVLQPLVVPVLQPEPIGVTQLHERKVVAIVHHDVQFLVK